MSVAVVCGNRLGTGDLSGALGAFLLLAANVICVNLSAVVTFVAQGIRPRRWWEADRARRATRFALIIWSTLLLALVAVIFASAKH